jgi:acyl-ACP thioesterase
VGAELRIERRIERPYRVRFDEAGADGRLRSSGYLRYAQDLAWIHSESAGFGRDWYRDRGLTWLVRAVELDIVEATPYGTEMTVSTEVVGFRRVWARRRSEFHGRDSERPLAAAITDWVLLSDGGTPARVPQEIVDVFVDPQPEFTPLRLNVPAAPSAATTNELSVRRSELDPMAHVNNATYLDYLDEHYLAGKRAIQPIELPRRYRAEFLVSAEPDVRLIGRGWQDGFAWWYRLEDDSGREMLRARLETDPATWVGG